MSPPADGMAPDAGCQVPGSTRRPGPDGSSYHRGRGRHWLGGRQVAQRGPRISVRGCSWRHAEYEYGAGAGGSVWFELPEVWCALWRRAPKTCHLMPEEHERPRQAWFLVGTSYWEGHPGVLVQLRAGQGGAVMQPWAHELPDQPLSLLESAAEQWAGLAPAYE